MIIKVKNNCFNGNNSFKTIKIFRSFCPENYTKCRFFDAKSVCTCAKEDAPGNCVQKEKLIEGAMKLLNIDENDACEVIENFYENIVGGKV